ncbi:UDP-glucuronosyltransferase 2B19-like [Camponotus floridanus]|uniref:UDP-glucuronosyltransferase 2B19-like n=1 Tax=Camponotus floridanus TaxID=104421 RepID=UPI000DC686D5|nr:UDP-glucuronosyltransferase 2B19-like [Camponotus floridanus]
MLKCFFIYCILMGFATVSNSLSILVIEALPSPSHHLWTTNLVKGLLRKGHHVHAVSLYETKVKGTLGQNLTYAVFDNLVKEMRGDENADASEWEKYNVFYMIYFVYEWSTVVSKKVIETKAATELLEMIKEVEFDIIVQDITMPECLYSLWEVAKGKPPVVGYLPFGTAPWLKYYIGGPHYPTVRSFPYKNLAKPINLWERTLNVLYYILDDLVRQYYYMPISQQITKQYIGHEIRSLFEIEKNITIILINSHSAFEPGIPLPPNAIEIGGLHAQAVQGITNEETTTYPDSIRKFLDEATDGVVIISLGTNVKWKSIGLDKLEAVTQALSKLKQRALWKLDIEMPFQVPNNIMILKWMPQNEILSHKNVKAIWTHGGLLSTQEAIWKGVPIIGMPFFIDQKYNIALLINKGVAVQLDINTLSTESILDAFEKILYNESYTKNMKQLSSEFRDRPVPPLDLAVWWIEYAARHPHGSLESPLRSQSWVEQNLIDVYGFLFFNLIIILLTVYFVLKKLFNFCHDHIYAVSKSQKKKQM